jgi:DNA-binding NtrC family response regulator
VSVEPTNRRFVDSPRPHILVVEDDPGVRAAMRMLLEIEGYRISTASTLTESLALARANRDIEILIVDFHLSGGELGTDAVRSIRTILGPAVRAVLITGDISGAAVEMAHDNDLQTIRKPIKPDHLIRLLRGFEEDRV